MMDLPNHSQPPKHVYAYGINPDDMLRMIEGTSFSRSGSDIERPFASIINDENTLESRSTMRNRWPDAEQHRRDYAATNHYSQTTEAEQPPQFWRNRFRRQ